MTEPRSPIDRLLDQLAWKPIAQPDDTNDSMPYATHSGELTIEGFGAMRVFQLNTGDRVIDANDFERFFGIVWELEEGP